VATIEDQDHLTLWLAAHVAPAERRVDQVREEMLIEFRRQRIEPPTPGRQLRMVRSALRSAEQRWASVISGRLDLAAADRLMNLIATGSDDDEVTDSESLLALIKASPGNVSLESMITEISKLQAVRTLGLPFDLFADIAPKVVDSWRVRAAVEAPSHLRRHAGQMTVMLLAALVHQREREITDTLVELLIATVHRIGARAERRVTNELINAFRRVTGKENILFAIAEAALEQPDDPVRAVVFPAVVEGEQTLRELVHEFKTTGPVYRRTVQTTLRASYTGHYRRGLIALLEVLEFRSNNTAHQPVIQALALIGRYAKAGNLTFYPTGELVPSHRGTTGDWADLVHRFTRSSPSRRCGSSCDARKSGWSAPTPGATPTTICRQTSTSDAARATASRKPLDPAVFVDDLRSEMSAALAELNNAVPAWTGSASPTDRRVQSPCPSTKQPPSRGTCAASRRRSNANGAPSP
jgi:hypothetical protein